MGNDESNLAKAAGFGPRPKTHPKYSMTVTITILEYYKYIYVDIVDMGVWSAKPVTRDVS